MSDAAPNTPPPSPPPPQPPRDLVAAEAAVNAEAADRASREAANANAAPRMKLMASVIKTVAVCMVVMLLITATTAVYLAKAMSRTAVAVAESSSQGMAETADRMLQFLHSSSSQTNFTVQATEINGSNYLQFATINDTSFIEYRDQSTVMGVALPDVTVVARAPVEYTYYLDLNGKWRFEMEGDGLLRVFAPEIQHNKPAVDVSKLEYFVTEGSVLRREGAAQERFKEQFMQRIGVQARRNIRWVRGEGRVQTEAFVRNWLMQRFEGAAHDLRIEVYFPDDPAPPPVVPAPSVADGPIIKPGPIPPLERRN